MGLAPHTHQIKNAGLTMHRLAVEDNRARCAEARGDEEEAKRRARIALGTIEEVLGDLSVARHSLKQLAQADEYISRGRE